MLAEALEALPFVELWVVDFEFVATPGEPPDPVCMVAHELRSGRQLNLRRQELRTLGAAPFDTGPNSLFVAYFASAEIGCFLALGWPVPERILDGATLLTRFGWPKGQSWLTFHGPRAAHRGSWSLIHGILVPQGVGLPTVIQNACPPVLYRRSLLQRELPCCL